MIVQACLNGVRSQNYHPALPLTPSDTARDATACITAGAAELHIHPRTADGRESLSAVDETILAIRISCPGSLIGVSTGAWIEKNTYQTCISIEKWQERPDYASVNLSEPDAPAVMDTLHRVGIGIEAGLGSVADAERFILYPKCHNVFRILIEIEEQNIQAAYKLSENINNVINASNIRRPILLHGFDATVWPFITLATKKRWSTRVGLEDGRQLPDGSITPSNAALVTAAVQAFRTA